MQGIASPSEDATISRPELATKDLSHLSLGQALEDQRASGEIEPCFVHIGAAVLASGYSCLQRQLSDTSVPTTSIVPQDGNHRQNDRFYNPTSVVLDFFRPSFYESCGRSGDARGPENTASTRLETQHPFAATWAPTASLAWELLYASRLSNATEGIRRTTCKNPSAAATEYYRDHVFILDKLGEAG